MIDLEVPKKFEPLVQQAHTVALEVLRPISRKYDLAEHEYPKELDMLAALIDGLDEGGASSGAGATGASQAERNGDGGNRNGSKMAGQADCVASSVKEDLPVPVPVARLAFP